MNTFRGLPVWTSVWNPVTDSRRESNNGLLDTSFAPLCDVEEQDDHYLLSLEVPGMKKDDIKIEVVDRELTVSGERQRTSMKNERLAYTERRFGKFQRKFSLPVEVDTSLIEANYQDGLLRLVVPKAEAVRPRQIKITTGSDSSQFFEKLTNKFREKDKQHAPPPQREQVAS
jgi:HSP20 family protein